jgi:ribosomal protein S18 acetylase RimI-like enzyme
MTDLTQIMDETWPAAEYQCLGPWMIRRGGGGGKRVSAANPIADWTQEDIPLAAQAMRDLGQNPLFLIRDDRLDDALAQAGYGIVDPVIVYAIPCAALSQMDQGDSYAHWPPLAIMCEIWAAAGIGPDRLAVMTRAQTKTAIMVRGQDRTAGVCFVAVSGKTAMLHALAVAPQHRRQGSAQKLLSAAADWAQSQGADTLSLAVTTANTPARRLYEKLGMQIVGQYHYRSLD